ncbi:MAG TPA: TIGR02270 family protein [Vicinamibacterales bacterium]|jgi:uncharacterized protein (TIGR02270 family)
MIVPAIVQQHADDAAILASNRTALVEAPHHRLDQLDRFDRRLAAHLDGLRLSGEEGWALCEAALENPSPGAVFTITVRALEERDDTRLDRVFALVQAVPETCAGLLAAFEWIESTRLHGTVASLLGHRDGFKRMVGVAACAAHRVDPKILSGGCLRDTDPAVRARSFQAVGELGLCDALSSCVAALTDADDDGRFRAAWSAVLLGDRNRALEALTQRGLSAGPHRARAFRLALQAMKTGAAHGVLQQLSGNAENARWLIHGSGIVGDPMYVPWLLKQMGDRSAARLAGEAFSTIAGVQLGQAALDGPAPENFESGPTDDPDDPNIDMDPDDGLPWPDPERVQRWWDAHTSRFTPGQRYFMGAPVTREHCVAVLKNGYQRQRILAAHYLCLLEPGTPLFNTSAPAWRQQRLLAGMN